LQARFSRLITRTKYLAGNDSCSWLSASTSVLLTPGNGSTVDDVERSFPDLTRAQVYECLAYYEDHRAQIDSLVARQMSSEL